MGDRANVFIPEYKTKPEENKGVYLYTHWGGSRLPLLVQEVLKREKRWDDRMYLARMVFSAMVKGDIDGETGYGIGASIGDNEHRIVVLDCDEGKIAFGDEHDRGVSTQNAQWIPFSEFIKMNENAVMELYGMTPDDD